MSGLYSDHLASRIRGMASESPPRAGQLFLARFPRTSLADEVAESLLQGQVSQVRVHIENREYMLPCIDLSNGIKFIFVRATSRPVGTDAPLHVVTSNFAGALRDYVADSIYRDQGLAIVIITDSDLDTLKATEDLFKPGGVLNTNNIVNDLLDVSAYTKPQCRILIDALKPYLTRNTLTEDSTEALISLRSALIDEKPDEIPHLIGRLPGLLREDLITEDFFRDSRGEDELNKAIADMMADNARHADRIEKALRKNARSTLPSYYSEEFVEQVANDPDQWHQLGHAQARRSITRTPPVGIELIDVSSKHRFYAPPDSDTDGGMISVIVCSEGASTINIQFLGEIKNSSHRVTGSKGYKPRMEKSETSLKLNFESIPPNEPKFYRVQIWTTTLTPKGKPDKEVKVAFVPPWFFSASDACALEVDALTESLVCIGSGPISLDDPQQSCGSVVFEKITMVDEEILDLTGPVEIQPEVKGGKDNVKVYIGHQNMPKVPILFTMDGGEEERDEVIFPLLLQAISAPGVWSDGKLRLIKGLTVEYSRGEIYIPNGRKLRLTDEITELLNLEYLIAKEDSILPRSVEGSELKEARLERQHEQSLDDGLKQAYSALFNHFRCSGTTPSTDPWGEDIQELARNVVDAYLTAVDKTSSLKILSVIGTINSRTLDRSWVTAYHPLMLAYALRLVEWRDNELIPHGRTEGFREDHFLARFNTAGLLPFRHFSRTDSVLTGGTQEFSRLWVVYSAVNRPGSTTPDFMSRVISDKLESFCNSYQILFDIHPERTLVINLVNLGNLGPIIKGISTFFKKILKENKHAIPRILLRIYGPYSDGIELDSFFSDNAYSRLRTQMRKYDDEIVDLLLLRLSYVRAGEYEGDLEPAHITFFRGILKEKPGWGQPENSGLKSGMYCQGLYPSKSIDVGTDTDGSVYTVGFGSDDNDHGLVIEVARASNALEASSIFRTFQRGAFIKQTVESQHLSGDLSHIWEGSLWVIHVQPNVSLEFYLNVPGAGKRNDPRIIIHYSDQYDPSSPSYDVITSTIHRNHYLAALNHAIQTSHLSDVLDAEIVLKNLVSIDGELALKLQKADKKYAVEYMGFIGALALSRNLLNRGMPDHIWVPLSLSELVRQTHSDGSEGSGILQYQSPGEACDDFCFVGCPRDSSGNYKVRLWIVEAKGGTSKTSKGKDQVIGAHRQILDLLDPPKGNSDIEIARGLFGRVVVDVARRMAHYEVISKEDWGNISAHGRRLIEGEYELDSLKTSSGQYGEVVQISSMTNSASVEHDEQVRVIHAPIRVIEVLKNKKLDELVPDLDIRSLIRYEMTTENERRPEEVKLPTELELPPANVADVAVKTESPAVKAQEIISDVPKEIAQVLAVPLVAPPSSPPTAPGTESSVIKLNGPPATKWEFLEMSPPAETQMDIGPLLADLKRGFDSLGVEIYSPSPSTVTIGPRRVSVDIVPKEGQRVEKVMKSLDTLSVSIKAKGKIQADLEPASGAIRLSIPTGEPRDIRIREAFENLGEKLISSLLTIPLGIDTRNRHRLLSLPEERHVLIGGTTGSGKSNFLTTTIISLALSMTPNDLKISILDPKGVDFRKLASLPHVVAGGYIDNASDCIEFLHKIIEEDLPKRQNMLKSSGYSSIYEMRQEGTGEMNAQMPFHVIMIDEYADLIMSLTKGKDEFEDSVTRLAQIGRALGYIIILSTQRPSADIVSGKIKANFPCRIAFRLPSSRDSVVILDEAGAEDLAGAGDMIVKTQTSTMRIQAYRTTSKDVATAIQHLNDVSKT